MQNIEVIPESELKKLKELNDELGRTKQSATELLKPITQLSNELSNSAINYKALTNAINRYEELLDSATQTDKQVVKLMQEKEKLTAKLAAGESKYAKEVAELREQIRKQTHENKVHAQGVLAQANSVEALRVKVKQLEKEWKTADRNTPNFKRLTKELGDARKELTSLEGSAKNFSRGVGNYFGGIMKSFTSIFAAGAAVSAIVGTIKNATKTIAEFEQANANLATILGKSRGEITSLTSSAKQLGISTEWSASKVTELQTELAKLGFDEREIMNMQAHVLRFATAIGTDLTGAAELAGATLKSFSLDSTQTERAVSVLTVGANKSALSFEYLNAAMSIVAPVAKAFGYTLEDTVALLGTLSDAGFDASSAATATRNILLNLADVNGALAKSLGRSVKTLPELMEGLKSLNAAGIDLHTTLELTDKRSVAAFNTFLSGADDVLELRDALEDVNGELERTQKERLDTLEGSVKKLKSAWEGLMLSFSNSTGALRDTADAVTFLVNAMNRAVDPEGARQADQAAAYNEVLAERGDFINDLAKIYQNESDIEEQYFSQTNTRIGDYQKKYEILLEKQQKMVEKFRKIPPGSIYFFIYKQWLEKATTAMNSAHDLWVNTVNAGAQAWDNYKKSAHKDSDDDPGASTFIKPLSTGDIKRMEREIKKLRDNQKKIAEDEKKATQEIANLAIQVKISTNKRILSDDKKAYGERLSALDGFLQQQAQRIKQVRDQQVQNLIDKLVSTENNGISTEAQAREAGKEQIKAIESKAQDDLNNIAISGNDTRISIIESYLTREAELITREASKRANEINTLESMALQELAAKFSKGKVNTEEYENEKLIITRKYAKERLQADIAVLNQSMALLDEQITENAGNEDILVELTERRAKLQMEIDKQVVDYGIYLNGIKTEDFKKDKDKELEIEKQVAEKRKEIILGLVDFATTLSNAATENALANLEKEQKAEEKRFDDERDQIERLYEAGAIAKEDADARKRERDDAEKARMEELEQKRKEIQIRQAKFEKAATITQIAINTAAAIMSQLKTTPLPLGAPLVAAIAAMGAVQLATAIAQPIPAYAEGTGKDGHKGGWAMVGDGGIPEMAISPSGKIYKTPAYPSLANLEKGSIVLPNYDLAMRQLIMPEVQRIPERQEPRVKDRTGEVIASNQEIVKAVNEIKTRFGKHTKTTRYDNQINNSNKRSRS